MRGIAILTLMLCALATRAATVPGFDLRWLVDEADLIVVGTVYAVQDLGHIDYDRGSGGTISARDQIATVAVGQVLKGVADTRGPRVRFVRPVEVSTGIIPLTDGTYRLVFLRKAGDVFEPVSPYWPSAAVSPGAVAEGDDPYVRALSIIAAGLQTDASHNHKQEALRLLSRIDHPVAVAALNAALDDDSEEIRLRAAGQLLQIGQLNALPIVEAVLTDQVPDDTNTYLAMIRNNLSASLRQLRSEEAVPALVRLMALPNPDTRRAAVYALAQMRSLTTVGLLADALDDADVEVRWSATLGLARLSGQDSLITSMDYFRSDEARVIEPLRAWALTR